jgi:hypothetical protein
MSGYIPPLTLLFHGETELFSFEIEANHQFQTPADLTRKTRSGIHWRGTLYGPQSWSGYDDKKNIIVEDSIEKSSKS